MKIILSINEAQQLIKNRLYDDFEVAIETPNSVPFSAPILNLSSILETVRSYRYQSDQKISAIKALRENVSAQGFHIGLGEAKAFVESIG